MWKTSSYEIMGRSHIKTDTPCQDKTFCLQENDVTVIALADGAGSASLSHFGAERATKAIATHMTEHFDSIINNPDGLAVKQEILSLLKDSLTKEAETQNCDLEDLACTLLVAALKDEVFLLIHLGDGVIAMHKNQELKLASGPDNGEFANSTFFVTSKNAIQHLKLFKGSTQGLTGFALMSDGTADSFYHKKNGQISKGVKKLIDCSLLFSPDKFDAFLDYNFKQVIQKNTMDDCSIAILSNSEHRMQTYESLAASAKCDMFQINPKNKNIAAKRLAKFEQILSHLSAQPKRLDTLAKDMHLKKKYVKRDLSILENQGLVTRKKGCYQSNLQEENPLLLK